MPRNKTRNGFSLIEICTSMFIILIILTALISSSAVYNLIRNRNLTSAASKIASSQIETLRSMDSLPLCPSPNGCNFSVSDITQLPSGSAMQFIDPYNGSSDIKLVTTQVSWLIRGTTISVSYSTLIYKNGLE